MFLKYDSLSGGEALAMTSAFSELNPPPGANAVCLSITGGNVAVATDGTAPDGNHVLAPGCYFYNGDLTELVFTKSGATAATVTADFIQAIGVA